MWRERRQEATTKAPAAPDGTRFAREEVVDVLAEGLWSLILADRWPGVRAVATTKTGDPEAGTSAHTQPTENAGV